MTRKKLSPLAAHAVVKPIRNGLLSALSANDLNKILPDLQRISIPLGTIMTKAGRPIEHAFFPESGMISLVQRLEDGGMTEVGIIGSEGFFGVPLLMGARSSPIEPMIQGEGILLRISAANLTRHAESLPAFRQILLRYAQALASQLAQTAACNSRHLLQQRLGRWLLEAHDRLGGPELRLSHEFLSLMLGTRRAGVTTGLGLLGASGAITVQRGRILIADRTKLERAACECYKSVRAEFKRLLP